MDGGGVHRQGQKSIYHLYLDALGDDVGLSEVADGKLWSMGCCFDFEEWALVDRN